MNIFDKIDIINFKKGIKYSIIITSIITLMFLPIYLSNQLHRGIEPFAELFLFVGGLLLIISGCIGPGRYFKEYPVFIVQPVSSDSFFENIPISVITQHDGVKKARVFINGDEVRSIEIEKSVQIVIKRDDINVQVINNLWLEVDGIKSNSVSFTFFEFNESMTIEEVDEYSKFDELLSELVIKDLQKRYTDKVNSNLGSISLGFLVFGIITMFGSALLSYL